MDRADIIRAYGKAPRIWPEDVVRHSGLAEARQLYLNRFLSIYDGDPFLVRLLIESGRFLVYHIIIVLEAAQNPAKRETWLTVGYLKETMSVFGLASARQVDHLIARLCAVGFLEMQPAPYDRRVRVLKSTDRMRKHDRDWLSAHYAPLAVLYPQNNYDRIFQHDEAFQLVHRRTVLALLPLAAQELRATPDMMLFFDRAAGHLILAALLQAAQEAQATVPYADTGERFGVSRTHVRKLLVDAAAAGLVKLHARGGQRVEILPRLWASYDRGIAGGMYLHDMAYEAAMEEDRNITLQ